MHQRKQMHSKVTLFNYLDEASASQCYKEIRFMVTTVNAIEHESGEALII